jgi:ribonuclease BN (tRNA processing enzyme)
MVTFLGTSGETVGTARRAPSVALSRGKDVWLFDAGEDTQRVVQEIEYVKPSKVRGLACWLFLSMSLSVCLGCWLAGWLSGWALRQGCRQQMGTQCRRPHGPLCHTDQPAPSNRPQIFRIFVSSLRAERVLGLPGLICTVGSAREHGHENADIPVHVYGPPGTADFLASVYQVCVWGGVWSRLWMYLLGAGACLA